MEKKELIDLSEEILKEIELDEAPLSNICFKCLRLTRLLDDEKGMKFFKAETGGYPRTDDGRIEREYWNIGYSLAGRGYTDNINGEKEQLIFTDTISEMEEMIETGKISIEAAKDPSVSISSANPHQFVSAPVGNYSERTRHYKAIKTNISRLTKVRGAIYKYILEINGKLKNDEVYMRLLEKNHKKTVSKLTKICPDLIMEFNSIYNNIDSNNPVDLDNCVHTCRRILKTLADYLFPVNADLKEITLEGCKLKLGEEQYVNRLLAFIDSKSNSKTYNKIVGSSLEDISKRMHSIYSASCKGSHTELTSFEVERYVLYTYLFLDDISNLIE